MTDDQKKDDAPKAEPKAKAEKFVENPRYGVKVED